MNNLDERINAARLAGAHSIRTLNKFKNYLLEIGLAKYDKAILPLELMRQGQAGTRLQAAGCETAPVVMQHTQSKIIPFPGVTMNQEDNFQNTLDGFLREMDYFE